MCEQCHQPDWFCKNKNHKAEYGSKKIETERTGYGTLTLDFKEKTIVIKFPENWEEMTSEEQYLWVSKHINP